MIPLTQLPVEVTADSGQRWANLGVVVIVVVITTTPHSFPSYFCFHFFLLRRALCTRPGHHSRPEFRAPKVRVPTGACQKLKFRVHYSVVAFQHLRASERERESSWCHVDRQSEGTKRSWGIWELGDGHKSERYNGSIRVICNSLWVRVGGCGDLEPGAQ